jgi:hypothetical protein
MGLLLTWVVASCLAGLVIGFALKALGRGFGDDE